MLGVKTPGSLGRAGLELAGNAAGQSPPATPRGPSPAGSWSGFRPATRSVTMRAVPNAIVQPMYPANTGCGRGPDGGPPLIGQQRTLPPLAPPRNTRARISALPLPPAPATPRPPHAPPPTTVRRPSPHPKKKPYPCNPPTISRQPHPPHSDLPALPPPPLPTDPSPPPPPTSVTAWPSLARKYAAVTPAIPPPRTRILMSALSGRENTAGPKLPARRPGRTRGRGRAVRSRVPGGRARDTSAPASRRRRRSRERSPSRGTRTGSAVRARGTCSAGV